MSVDLVGQKFTRLTVIELVGINEQRHCLWLCECKCGEKTIVPSNDLRSGNTRSCGCSRIKHGHSMDARKSKTYKTWADMIQRCTNVNNERYHDYGGRGINVHKRWMKFNDFLADMGKSPTKNHVIDRIDNNGNYCNSNCRWVTSKQNNRNKRNNHMITFNGKTQCLAAWAEEIGIESNTLWKRVCVYKWSFKKVIETSVKYCERKSV